MAGKIFTYPLRAPVSGKTAADNPTEVIDYVVFQRKRIKYKDGGKPYYGLNVPNNKAEFKKNDFKVYIAMPQNIQTAYQPTYRQLNIGVGGRALIQTLGSGNDYESLAKTLEDASKAALPEFTIGTFAQAAQGAAQFLGLAGQIDANSIIELTQGRVFNPYTEQLFNNMQFRQHNFSFKMFARNEKESKEIQSIIRYMKTGAVPRYGTDSDRDVDNADRFFEVPDKYDIKFIRVNPNTGAVAENLHFKIHTSVCSGVSVNYTPDGQYNAIKPEGRSATWNGAEGTVEGSPLQVPAVVLNMSFTETQFVTQRDVVRGY